MWLKLEGGVIAATGLEIIPPQTTLTAGETYLLLWKFTPEGAAAEEITWTYSEQGIVAVTQDNKLEALGEGSCTLTGTTKSGLKGSAEVSVKWPDHPKLVLDSPGSISLAEGETYQLEWHFLPDIGTPPVVTWESASPEYLEVDENGLLTAKERIGTAVTGTYGPEGEQQTVTVNVEITPPEWELVGFNSQAIKPGTTLEFRYPNREVTNQDGERVKPGEFAVYDFITDASAFLSYDQGSPVEMAFPTVEKSKGSSTFASVTFDKPGGYKVVYFGDGWDEECFILVSDSLLPDSLHVKTGESVTLLDRSSWSDSLCGYLVLDKRGDINCALVDDWIEFGGSADNDIIRIHGISSGTMTITLSDIEGSILDTCEVTVTGGQVYAPNVWASLNRVNENSAVIDVGADGQCDFNALLCRGTPEPALHDKLFWGRVIKMKTILGATEGVFTFDELTPNQTYTVFVYGSRVGLDSNVQGITFTTPNPVTVEASLGTIGETSATINMKANQDCTLITGLYPGGSELPATGADIQAKAQQYKTQEYKTVNDAANGSATFDKLNSGTSYSVFISSIDKDGNYSPVKRLDFTTKKPVASMHGGSGSSSGGSGGGGGGSDDRVTIRVTDITGVPAQILAGQTITLNPVVHPSNATRKTVTWSIPQEYAGYISIDGNRLTGIAASEAGKPAVLRATIAKGGLEEKDYVKDFQIQVMAPVSLSKPEGLKTGEVNPLPPAKENAGEAYVQEFTATGGMGSPYTFELKDSSLPDGWTLAAVKGSDDKAKLSGMPGQIGSYPFTVRVKDKDGNFTDYKLTLEVTATGFQAVTDITEIPTQILVGQTLELTPTVIPANASYKSITWSIQEGSGTRLRLNGNSLTGVAASEAGKHAVLRATIANGGANGQDFTQDFQIQVLAPVRLTEPNNLSPDAMNQLVAKTSSTDNYQQEFKAKGGAGGPYTFTLTNSSLPTGWKLEPVGNSTDKAKLSGMPGQTGSYPFTVRVKDKDGNFTDYNFTLTVSADEFVPVTNITGIPAYVMVEKTVTLDGVIEPANATNKTIIWELLNENSSYCSLTANKLTTGIFTGEARLRATVMGGLGTEDYTKEFTIAIYFPIYMQWPGEGSLTDAQMGQQYSQEFEATNGMPPDADYWFAVVDGSLPNGLTLKKVPATTHKAELAGIPTEDGTFEFTIRVTDGDGNHEDFSYTLEVKGIMRNILPIQKGVPPKDDLIIDEDAEIASPSDATPVEDTEKDGSTEDGNSQKASPSNATPSDI